MILIRPQQVSGEASSESGPQDFQFRRKNEVPRARTQAVLGTAVRAISAPAESGIAIANNQSMKRPVFKPNKLAACVGLIFMIAICAAGQSDQLATRSRTVGTAREVETAPTPRKVFVHSTSLLVGGNVVEEKLLQNSEFKRLGFVITREPRDADFVLELRHDVLTKYVFTVIDAKTANVIAGGKLSSLGGTVAGKVANRFVKEMSATKQP